MFRNLLKLLASLKPLLDKIRELFGDIPVQDIIAILTRLLQVGPPPAIDDEKALRAWLTTGVAVADEIADLTPTDIDDKTTDFVLRMIQNDNVWGVFYSILKTFSEGGDPDHLIVGSQLADTKELVDFSPLTIIAIAEAIWKLIELFKD